MIGYAAVADRSQARAIDRLDGSDVRAVRAPHTVGPLLPHQIALSTTSDGRRDAKCEPRGYCARFCQMADCSKRSINHFY